MYIGTVPINGAQIGNGELEMKGEACQSRMVSFMF
jgi:hypothetical protein